MKFPRSIIGAIVIVLLGVTVFSNADSVRGAPPVSTTACYGQIVEAMASVHDEFRAVVFGSRKDNDGKFTVLTGGFSQAEHVGILETRERLSSELVEPTVESYRVLRCRMSAVCEAMKASYEVNGGSTLTVKQLGCSDQTGRSFDQCSFKESGMTQQDVTNLATECKRLVIKSLETERAALHLAFSYDSGYRALLQLSGMVDWFQGDFPDEVLKPIRDMVNLLGKLHEIPCFIGQCDRPDTSILSTSSSSSSTSFSSSSSSSLSFSSSSSFPGL